MVCLRIKGMKQLLFTEVYGWVIGTITSRLGKDIPIRPVQVSYRSRPWLYRKYFIWIKPINQLKKAVWATSKQIALWRIQNRSIIRSLFSNTWVRPIRKCKIEIHFCHYWQHITDESSRFEMVDSPIPKNVVSYTLSVDTRGSYQCKLTMSMTILIYKICKLMRNHMARHTLSIDTHGNISQNWISGYQLIRMIQSRNYL